MLQLFIKYVGGCPVNQKLQYSVIRTIRDPRTVSTEEGLLARRIEKAFLEEVLPGQRDGRWVDIEGQPLREGCSK